MFEAPLQDFGALVRSGSASVPDYAAQEAQKQIIGLRRQELQAQVEETKRKLAQREAFETDIAEVMTNPTAEGYARVIAKHPEFASQVKASHDILDGARKSADLRQMAEIYSASANGKHDVAARLMRARIEADKEADGIADPSDEAILAALESNDPVQQKAALGIMGVGISAITGPEKFGATLGSLTEDSKDFTLVPGARRYAADGTLIAEAPFAPRPLTVGEGETIVEYQPGGGGAAGGGGSPRGIRNNNPGNLKDGPFAKAQPGYKGTDKDGFAVFADPSSGQSAAVTLLSNKYLKNGVNTPDAIVERYAPPGENTPEQRANYKAHIAQALGIGVGDPIPVSRAAELHQAMAGFENGTGGGPKVIAQGDPKPVKVAEPSETRVVAGQTYVKVNGSWYRKTR